MLYHPLENLAVVPKTTDLPLRYLLHFQLIADETFAPWGSWHALRGITRSEKPHSQHAVLQSRNFVSRQLHPTAGIPSGQFALIILCITQLVLSPIPNQIPSLFAADVGTVKEGMRARHPGMRLSDLPCKRTLKQNYEVSAATSCFNVEDPALKY